MHRTIASVVLALCLVGCAPKAPPGEPVALLTVETQTGFGGCVLDLFWVADVVAGPASGAPTNGATGEPLAWPNGFTARRAGSEVEVLDPAGNVVLTTGRRYRMCPPEDSRTSGQGVVARSPYGGWVVGKVDPCLFCELGGYGDPGNGVVSPSGRPEPTDSPE